MLLEEAFAERDLWVGQLRTPPGSVGGWHHHGDHDTYTYLVEGRARLDWGVGGREGVDLYPGDFAHVPHHLVHRESNPGAASNLLILFRRGRGPALVAADPP